MLSIKCFYVKREMTPIKELITKAVDRPQRRHDPAPTSRSNPQSSVAFAVATIVFTRRNPSEPLSVLVSLCLSVRLSASPLVFFNSSTSLCNRNCFAFPTLTRPYFALAQICAYSLTSYIPRPLATFSQALLPRPCPSPLSASIFSLCV